MRNGGPVAHWPKIAVPLTGRQREIREDFMQHWLQVLPKRFAPIEVINHRLAVARCTPPCHTLEVGAGLGAHLAYEDLTAQRYTALEFRPELAATIRSAYPAVNVLVGDVQTRIDAPDASFDRVIAIHVLEHLLDLPAALREIRRVMKPDGVFGAVLPCEGGVAYRWARNASARRIFEKRYGCSYDWFVQAEHVNNVWELLSCLREHFPSCRVTYWPLLVPSVQANLVLGVTCRLHDA